MRDRKKQQQLRMTKGEPNIEPQNAHTHISRVIRIKVCDITQNKKGNKSHT